MRSPFYALLAAFVLTGCAATEEFAQSDNAADALGAAASGDMQGVGEAAANEAVDRTVDKAADKAMDSVASKFGPFGGIAAGFLKDSAKDSAKQAVKGQVKSAVASEPAAVSDAPGFVAESSETAALATEDGETAAPASTESEPLPSYGPTVVGYTDDGRVLKRFPASAAGPVKIECMVTTEAPSRNFLPLDIRITPMSEVTELKVKIEPEAGVILQEGPIKKDLDKAPGHHWTKRVHALPADDRDSFLRVTTSAAGIASRTVLCPLGSIPTTAPTAGESQDLSQIRS